jgi:hypothetical protein
MALEYVTADQLAATLGLPTPTTDPDVTQSAAAANEWLDGYLTPADPLDPHTDYEYCNRAALLVAVDMYSAPKAAGGQSMAVDFTPSPYTMGSAMMRRISGMVAPRRDTRGLAG